MTNEKKIVVLDSDKKNCQSLCVMLTQQDFRPIPLYALDDLENCLQKESCIAVIMDIDSIPASNKIIREMTIKHPYIYFMCTSKSRFHPELQDAICYHLYACLNKPIDPDELFYFLKSIYADETDTK